MSQTATEQSTRERILDVALDLFVEKGLRQDVASQRSPSAWDSPGGPVHYHFASKSDLLMALHLRLHQLTEAALDELGDGPVTIQAWEAFLDQGHRQDAGQPEAVRHASTQPVRLRGAAFGGP